MIMINTLTKQDMDLLSQYTRIAPVEQSNSFSRSSFQISEVNFRLKTDKASYEIVTHNTYFIELEKVVSGRITSYNYANSTIATLHDALMFVELDRV